MADFISVQIDRFVDDHQPGFVECSFFDTRGQKHSFVEKIPVVTTENLWFDSRYPQTGFIACQIEREVHDPDGPALQVNTELPWHVESTTGETRFVVRIGQVRSDRAA